MFIKVIAIVLSIALLPLTPLKAAEIALPKPGTMLGLTPAFNPAVLKGIKVHVNDPLNLEFIVAPGNNDNLAQEESAKLVKYFLAALTTPEKDMWVNLSPYEKDRIVPNSFGQTEMGRDLLAQDYILKQITASLVYPENEIGKEFWKRIYQEAGKKSGGTTVAINTFNKVWIMPDKAVIQENVKTGTAYIKEATLKVMLEADYLSAKKHAVTSKDSATEIVREMVIPQLTKEVNEGSHFAELRQMYHALVLAAWYKKKIENGVLSNVYVDRDKTQGISLSDPFAKQAIYDQYLRAFKKGVYNFVKEENDPITHQLIPRKYFSGGLTLNVSQRLKIDKAMTANEALAIVKQGLKLLTISVALSAAFAPSVFAQKEERPVFANSKDERDYDMVIPLQERGLKGELDAITRLGAIYKENNTTVALKALIKIAFSGDAQNSKLALEIILKSSLSGLKDFDTLQSAMRLGHPESKDAFIKFVENGNLEASMFLLGTTLPADLKIKAKQSILAFLKNPDRVTREDQWVNVRDKMMEEFNQDKSNVLAKEILIELAYVGSIRISAQIIESGLIELEPKRLVASLMTMGTADGSLMRYYEKYPSKELLRNIMKFLFETRRQTINLRGILSEYEISKEILGSNEFKDREPPQGNGFQEDSVLILAASGHEKSYAYALQHYPQKLLKHINTRLYLTALKGNEDSMSKLEEMAEDGDKEAINTIYDIWRSKFAVDVVRKRAKDFIESNFDYFSDLFDKGAWQEFAKDPKHKEIIDGLLEDVKTDPKVLIILDWLGLLTKEHVAYHPFSEEVFHELRSHWVEGLEIYFSYEGNPNEIFRVLANEWQGFVVRNLVQSFMQFDKTKLRRLFMQSLPRLNITKALGYLKDDNEKLQLIMYALQHNIPQSKDILKAYIQHNPNMAWDLYAIYNSGVITMDRADNSVLKHNPQIKEVLATVDISAFKLDGFIDGLDPVVSELIAIGNQSIFDVALKQSVTKPGIANDLLQLAGVLPGNLKDYIKNMENISPYAQSESLMRMFVLLGNKPAIKELLKNYKIEHGSLINTIFLASYNDPDFQDFKKTAKSFLDGVRAQNINAFKDSIKSMSPKEANEFMLKLYLSVLYDLQEQFNVMDFETFKDVALKMIAKMSLSATLNNANSGFEFGFNLLLRLNSMDEVLFVLNHELGHNVLDVILMEKKIDRFSLDEKKRIQIISIHEYFSDILAYAANGDVKRIDKLFNDNFLCNYCKDVDFNNFKILMEEGHVIPRTSVALFRYKAKAKGIDTAKFFAELFKNHRKVILDYSGDYTDFNEYFIYTLALQLGVTYVYNSGISIAENLDKLLDAKSANKAMLTNGGIDFDASHLNLVDESSGARIHFNALPDLFKQYRNIAGFVPTIKAVQPLESLNSFLNM